VEFIEDIKTSANLYRKLRRARKDGREMEVKTAVRIPVLTLGPRFLDSIEGCLIYNSDRKLYGAVQSVFNSLPYEAKRKLIFTPSDGGFVDRARFWKYILRPALSPKQYHKAMLLILNGYTTLKCRRAERRR